MVPAWVLHYEYAQEFGIHPQDVPKVVTVQAWHRWRLLRKAEAARNVYEAFKQGGAGNFSEQQRALFDWPHQEGEY